ASLALLAAQSHLKYQVWKPVAARITGLPVEVSTNTTVTAALEVSGLNLDQARIVWEASNQEPAFGASLTFTPTNHALHWVEAEAQWPDGRRVFGVAEFSVTNGLPIVSVTASDPRASEKGPDAGTFTFTRTGNLEQPLTVRFTLADNAARWTDYRSDSGSVPETITIPAGETAATLTFVPVDDSEYEGPESIRIRISENRNYNVGAPAEAVITIEDNEPPVAAPVITLQPQDRNALAGDEVILKVTATGAAPLRFQWRLNGAPIEGATSDTLTLKNIQAEAAGDYSAVVSNSGGSVTSQPAAITVTVPEAPINKPPTISPIQNRKTSMNMPTPVIPFVVGDRESAVELLTVRGRSSDGALVPEENILFNGLAASRALVIVPAPNQTGTAIITITVADDRGATASTSFELQVQAPDLEIQVFGGEVLLSWPTNATSYALEATDRYEDLGRWVPFLSAPYVIGDRYLVLIPLSRAAQFFRLRRAAMN
ncbi:MAG: immunoglobulin domain-containing protein, partial [Verrucomicrobia bacterium]|nr:immunoglobulin domain-containing protein [Verrucomicrobiota bacterium]